VRTPYRNIGVATLVLLGLVVSASCGLKRNPPERRQFVLDAPRPDAQDPLKDGPMIYLRMLRVSPLFEQQSFVYRKSDGTYVSDFHNQFFVLPAHNITDQARKWLTASGLFQYVTSAPGIVGEEHLLTGSVEELYGDLRGDGPRSVLSIDFIVLGTGDTQEIALAKEYTEAVPLDKTTPDALVKGWNQALVRILGRLEADLRKLDFSAPPADR
jgi:hypothetical protein